MGITCRRYGEQMDPYKDFAKLAANQLLERCPELRPAWDDSLLVGDEGEVIFYAVFAQIISPFLRYVFSTVPRSTNDRSESGHYTEERFREQEQWREIPIANSPEFGDLVNRLFEVFELWAESPNKHVREATYIELIEGEDEEVVMRGGPKLQELKEWFDNNSLGDAH
jgi:hypothetical protein